MLKKLDKYIILWVVTLIVFIFMTSLAIGKIYFNEKDGGFGFADFFQYLTNLSWTTQLVFYFLSIVFTFSRTAFNMLLFSFYFVVLGLTILVYILITVVLQYSDDVFVENFKKHTVGFVVLMNSVFHGWTVLFIMGYGFGYSNEICYVHRKIWYEYAGLPGKIFLFFFQSFGCLVLVVCYSQIVNAHEVYSVNMPNAVGWLVIIGSQLIGAVIYYLTIRKRNNDQRDWDYRIKD